MTSTPPEAASLLTEAIKTDEQDLRIAQLVASYSLLDPTRRANRRDVVISTLVTVLAARQPMTSERLFGAIRSMWKTSTLTDEVLTTALHDARAAGLVVERDSDGVASYFVSADAAAETQQDQLYVSRLLEDFRDQVSERLTEYAEAATLMKRQDRVVSHVLTAIARACQGSYQIDVPGSSKSVRPLSVSQGAVKQYASQLEPKSIRIPVRELALDALDVGEPFGNEIVHLVVVSGLLLGLTTQRGIAEAPSLEHIKVILDTSFLIGLVKPDDDSERRTLLELISLSNRCNATLVVADHTVDEWSRVWDGADAEMSDSGSRASTISSDILSRLVGNPFVAAYIDYRNAGGTHGWIRWSESHRDLYNLLQPLPISVEQYVEQDDIDSQCYERLYEALRRLSKDKTTPGWRNRSAAEADARTGTIVARWRRRRGEGSAVFVAKDRLTDLAYAECFPDSKPLVIQPMVWLQYVSCLIVDDPLARIDIADLIADVAVRDTVLSMASSHTLEEVLGFSDLLTSTGIEPSAQLARDLDDPSLFDAADALHQESSEDFMVRAQAVIARRGTRSNQRAANREAHLQTELDAMQRVVDNRTSEADTQRSRADSEQQRADDVTLEKDDLEKSYSRLRRIVHAGSASGIALIVLMLLWGYELLSGWGILAGGVAVVVGGVYAFHWVDDTESNPKRMWIVGFCQAAWHIGWSILL